MRAEKPLMATLPQCRKRAASRSALKGLHTMRPGSTIKPGEPAAFRCLQHDMQEFVNCSCHRRQYATS